MRFACWFGQPSLNLGKNRSLDGCSVHAVRQADSERSGTADAQQLAALATLMMPAFDSSCRAIRRCDHRGTSKASWSHVRQRLPRCSPLRTPSRKSLTAATSSDRLGAGLSPQAALTRRWVAIRAKTVKDMAHGPDDSGPAPRWQQPRRAAPLRHPAKLPEDYLVYYEPVISERYPDFVVLAPDLGVIIIEVKGWYPSDILGGDSHTIRVRMRGVERNEAHPVRQARRYQNDLRDECRKSRPARSLLLSRTREARASSTP